MKLMKLKGSVANSPVLKMSLTTALLVVACAALLAFHSNAENVCLSKAEKRILEIPLKLETLFTLTNLESENPAANFLKHKFEHPDHPEWGKLKLGESCAKCMSNNVKCFLSKCYFEPSCGCYIARCGDEMEKCSGVKTISGVCDELEAINALPKHDCTSDDEEKILQIPFSMDTAIAVLGDNEEATKANLMKHKFEHPVNKKWGKLRLEEACAKCFAAGVHCGFKKCMLNPTCECFETNCGNDFMECAGVKSLPGLCDELDAVNKKNQESEDQETEVQETEDQENEETKDADDHSDEL